MVKNPNSTSKNASLVELTPELENETYEQANLDDGSNDVPVEEGDSKPPNKGQQIARRRAAKGATSSTSGKTKATTNIKNTTRKSQEEEEDEYENFDAEMMALQEDNDEENGVYDGRDQDRRMGNECIRTIPQGMGSGNHNAWKTNVVSSDDYDDDDDDDEYDDLT